MVIDISSYAWYCVVLSARMDFQPARWIKSRLMSVVLSFIVCGCLWIISCRPDPIRRPWHKATWRVCTWTPTTLLTAANLRSVGLCVALYAWHCAVIVAICGLCAPNPFHEVYQRVSASSLPQLSLSLATKNAISIMNHSVPIIINGSFLRTSLAALPESPCIRPFREHKAVNLDEGTATSASELPGQCKRFKKTQRPNEQSHCQSDKLIGI